MVQNLKAIYERGTLTGAAEFLLLTQPAVSQQLTALETYMGVQLFERKPRKCCLPPTECNCTIKLTVPFHNLNLPKNNSKERVYSKDRS